MVDPPISSLQTRDHMRLVAGENLKKKKKNWFGVNKETKRVESARASFSNNKSAFAD